MSEREAEDDYGLAWEEDDSPSGERVTLQGVIPDSSNGLRLDQALALLFPEHSRSRLQQWLKQGQILVGGEAAAPRRRVLGGERVTVDAQALMAEHWTAQALPLSVVHADAAVVVIDKPAGWVVHPGAGNPDGTLVNALLHHFPELEAVPRAGVVHRLDKDTSGLLVVARTSAAHGHLVRQLASRSMGRVYLALAEGVPAGGFRVDAPIGRDPRQRLRMAVVGNGRPAVTHVAVEERFRAHALLRCRLETGRTHQIRVHLRHEGLPLVGDTLYGARGRLPKSPQPELLAALAGFSRQALHATRLVLAHPDDEREMTFDSTLPDDMQGVLTALRQDQALGAAEPGQP